MLLRSQKQIREQFWYTNAGTLSESAYKRAFETITKTAMTESQFCAIIFLSIDYMVQYFELVSINFSLLLNTCIKKHLQFVEKLILLHQKEFRYISPRYWDAIFTICDKFDSTKDYVEKQFCIDALERICNFLTFRTKLWVKNSSAATYVKKYGRKPRHTVVYNSFIIPNFAQYKDPLTYPQQKNFEKIENECHCKIQLNMSEFDCRIGEHYMILEVVFDYYKGNFLGFLDNLLYLIKRINSTKYFMKSLRTITRDENMYFSVLSDLPITELQLIEKNAHMGDKIPPFLNSYVISKRVYRLVIRDVYDQKVDINIESNEEMDYWSRHLSKLDIAKYKSAVSTFVSDYQCWVLIMKKWTQYRSMIHIRPKRRFSLSNRSLPSTEFPGKRDTDLESILKDSNDMRKSFSNENNSDTNEDDQEEGNENMEVRLSHPSILSAKSSRLDTGLRSVTTISDKLMNFFNILYDRKFHMKDVPDNLLNHTLRVILRCNTELEAGDEAIAKLSLPPVTIHTILKEHYNFNLKGNNFYTKQDRLKAYRLARSLKRRKKVNDQRQLYLENRRVVAEELEDLQDKEECPSVSIVLDLKTDDSVDVTFEQVSIGDDILFGNFRESKEQLSPEFKKEIFSVFGSVNVDILQLFNEKRITASPHWTEKIKAQKEKFFGLIPFPHKPIACNVTEVYKAQIKHDQIDMIYNGVSTNVYVTIKLLSGNDPNFDVEFPKMLKGKGIEIAFLKELNDPRGGLPKLISQIDRRQAHKKELNHSLCVLSFDLYLICASLSCAIGNLFDYHRKVLKASLSESNNEIRDLFELFEFEEKIEDAKSLFKIRLVNRTKDEIRALLKLSHDIRRFNELLFHSSCCKWRQEKCIYILYTSMNIDGNKKCQEPFLRKGGDRRLKRIETKCNCMITMRLLTRPHTGVHIPFVEIFYDFFKGNHFVAMDMLKNVLAENQGSPARIVNQRHLLCLPYEELWIIQDLEWLKKRASFLLAQDNIVDKSKSI